jgi:hypothetical protein
MHPEGPGDKWYIVTVGRRVGVFRHWTNVGPLVLGSAHSVYQRVDSYEEGLRQFNEAVLENNVRIL